MPTIQKFKLYAGNTYTFCPIVYAVAKTRKKSKSYKVSESKSVNYMYVCTSNNDNNKEADK